MLGFDDLLHRLSVARGARNWHPVLDMYYLIIEMSLNERYHYPELEGSADVIE